MNDVQTWGNGEDIGPQLLGTYEQELWPVIQRVVDEAPSVIINAGCAEGFYAIGLARLLTSAHVYAFDIDPAARDACCANAVLNDVETHVSVDVACSARRLADICDANPHIFAIIDIEGDEQALFGIPYVIDALSMATVIIELHEERCSEIEGTLITAFEASHLVSTVHSQGRNPHCFSFLDDQSDADKWMLICENRPRKQKWLIVEPRPDQTECGQR